MNETNNNRTIESYNAHIQEYMDSTPHEVSGVVKEWIDRTFSDIAKDARILEFGSAFGRDATYLEKQGYQVMCTDATPAFVDLLRQKGFNSDVLNAITDDLPEDIDVVLANAVLLHFTRNEANEVIGKVYNALNADGTFAFTLKQGEGEEWLDSKLGAPRFFTYWTEEQIRDVLSGAGFSEISVWGDGTGANHAHWLQIIAKKTDK